MELINANGATVVPTSPVYANGTVVFAPDASVPTNLKGYALSPTLTNDIQSTNPDVSIEIDTLPENIGLYIQNVPEGIDDNDSGTKKSGAWVYAIGSSNTVSSDNVVTTEYFIRAHKVQAE